MDTRTMVGAGAPPPPSEVKVRTMKSDLASMAKSGGGMPSFQNVEINNLSIEKEYTTPSHASSMATPVEVAQPLAVAQPAQPVQVAPVQQFQPAQVAPQQQLPQQPPVSQVMTTDTAPHKDLYPIFIVAVVAILAIGGVGYFAYITFFAGTSPTATTTTSTQTASLPVVAIATTTATSTTTSVLASSSSPATTATAPKTPSAPNAASQTATLTSADELSSPHVSLFKKPADQSIVIDLSDINASSYRKTMLNSLATASAASTIIEINPKTDSGASVNIQGLFSVAGASLFSQQTLASFNADATFFIYRDRNGLWPGYILALNAGQSSSSVATAVQQLEQSTSIGNLFLAAPGNSSSDGFTDSTNAGVPVRVLPFSGVSFPLYFSYGWHGNYLILSTSNNGFAAAVAGLQ